MRAAADKVNGQLSGLPDDVWHDVVCDTWTVKDVVGHLAAWSDLLLDGAEALASGTVDTVEAVDVDAWNAAQIARRSGWTTAEIRASWDAAVERAVRLADSLPQETCSQRQAVSWADEPVSVEDVFALWVLHIEQHIGSLTGEREKQPGGRAGNE